MLCAPVEPCTIARVFDDRELHAEADAQIRHLVLARVADRLDLAFDAALAEAARHQDRVHAFQTARPLALDHFGIDVVNVDARAVWMPAWISASVSDL